MANDLAPFVVLLVVECEGGIGGVVEIQFRHGLGVEFLVPDGEGNVAQAQWVVVSGLVILTRMQQEVKGNPNHIDGHGEFRVGEAWTRAVAW